MVDKRWDEVIKRWKREKLKCERCGEYFFEITNIGSWKCSQHALDRPPNSRLRWLCCKARNRGVAGMASKGCVRADHTTLSIQFNEDHDLQIPLPLMDCIGVHSQSIIEDNIDSTDSTRNIITIRRFDWKTADLLGRNDIYQPRY